MLWGLLASEDGELVRPPSMPALHPDSWNTRSPGLHTVHGSELHGQVKKLVPSQVHEPSTHEPWMSWAFTIEAELRRTIPNTNRATIPLCMLRYLLVALKIRMRAEDY
jgi:hypothetical protein